MEGDQGGKSGITWPFYFSTRSVWPSVCPHKRTLKVSRIVDRESLRFSTWFESRSRNRESTTRPCSNWENLIVSFLFFSPLFLFLSSRSRESRLDRILLFFLFRFRIELIFLLQVRTIFCILSYNRWISFIIYWPRATRRIIENNVW